MYGWRRRAGLERLARVEEGWASRQCWCRGAIDIELCGMTIRVALGIDEAESGAVGGTKAVS